MKTLFAIAFGVLCGLLAAGLILLVARQPSGKVVILLPPATPQPLIVQIYGSVASPGVYSLPPGSRVLDAIEAAGGLLADADLAAINLAEKVADGSQLFIPALGAPPGAAPPPAPDQKRSNPAALSTININTANQQELESLPGIGSSLAAQIILYREANGPFESLEDILEVPGIGPKTFEKIKGLISV